MLKNDRPLAGKVALVAGGTRGAGRGIAVELGALGAHVYVTGRTTRLEASDMKRSETIEDTAEMIEARGGTASAVRTDHSDSEQVRLLAEKIAAERGGLDILVNDIWGGDDLTKWGQTLWEHSLEDGLSIQRRSVHTHLITSRHMLPLMLDRPGGLVLEITDGTDYRFRGNVYYSLAKVSGIHLAAAMAEELRPYGIAAVALTPGFLRSEAMLDHFGVTEKNWRDAVKIEPHFIASETPAFVGQAAARLAADPDLMTFTGRALSSWELSDRYGFADADGNRPHWGRYAAENGL
ncbi:SDR family oxidoreductase [Saccharibacillus alkalitolerans]|uniref:SDR family NAD(P)-dependent oxidoreductase n=1 Tax=Saccharibacillus alkalitolerans TaxID=2705290 RepID=A0ABX0F2N8_9BACL|nr:SDR family oxidoreductase [Saccharibacillus alkalitolerans]NGZ74130.1 SDR family NAD(P)-dependent oxidoreductase [Saccharibacillus alkalitolerans]